MFKGLLPVNLPDNWFKGDTSAIRFANLDGKQAIDFRPVGGPVLAFWVSSTPESSQVFQHYEKVPEAAAAAADWGTSNQHAFAVCGRQVVKMFGQSSEELDLTHLA